jgi:2-oxoglutarate ferredoxin oxidoreductase subunit alpha
MPTKTEQADLNLAVFGAGGDARRIVIAPTNVEGCYRCAGKAFEMAERYQTPVIVLLDLYLSNRYEAMEFMPEHPFELDCNKGVAMTGVAAADPGQAYRRFAITADWISPRAIPGDEGCQHVVTGLEHNELGRPSDQPDVHGLMSHKRHEKLKAALDHPDFTVCKRFGDAGQVEVGILGWGSTFGEIMEAMLAAQAEGIRCAAMKVVMLSPFPTGPVAAFMDSCAEVLVPEVNYEGQFANLLTGAPMQVGVILEEIRRLAPSRPPLSAKVEAIGGTIT